MNLALLELNGEVIAANLNFDYGENLWIYNSGIHPDYYHLTSGWVLLGYLIRWSIEQGYKGIDFLHGDEGYKYRFGAEGRFIQRLIISR